MHVSSISIYIFSQIKLWRSILIMLDSRRSMRLWQHLPCRVRSKHGSGERRTFQARRGMRCLLPGNMQLQHRLKVVPPRPRCHRHRNQLLPPKQQWRVVQSSSPTLRHVHPSFSPHCQTWQRRHYSCAL